MERDFKGIWIPKEVWLTKKLTTTEKLFLVEIHSLDNENGCYATNSHFAEFFGLSVGRCSQIISSLEKKGFIETEFFLTDTKQVKKRVLKVKGGYLENIQGVFRKHTGGYLENIQGINTYTINTNYNTIVEYLNEKAETNYKPTSKKTQSLIKTRMSEGFTEKDFLTVIDKKVEEWKDTEMEKFLRPETLFSNKFESYLNQKNKTWRGTF